MSNFSNAQWKHDNAMPDEVSECEYPDQMKCSECGCTVELERQGVNVGTGRCAECGAYCESEPI